MKCPHCGEELGLNNICINPLCSYFGNTFSDDNITEEIQQNLNIDEADTSYNNTSNYNDDKHSYDTNSSSRSNFMNNAGNISDEEFKVFFGPKKLNYYLNNLKQYRVSKKFTSWNWPCFLLGPYWLLYRKMFALAFGYIVLNFIVTFLTETPFSLLLRIVTAVFANGLYIHHCESKIRKIKVSHNALDLNKYFLTLKKKGGTSLAVPIGLIILTSIVAIAIVCIFISLIFVPDSNIPSSLPGYYYF